MKKILLIVLIFSANLFAEVEWHSYKDAFNLQQSNLLKQDVFVMVISENCRYCHKMLSRIKSDKKFQSQLNKKYYNVLINTSKDFIPIDLDLGVTPSYFLLDYRTLEIKKGPIRGYIPTNNLLREIK